MAKKIIDEQIKLSIIVDGNVAQKELHDLEKATNSLTLKQVELRKQRDLLSNQGKRNTEEYKKLTAEIKRNSQEITENKTKMNQLQSQLGVTGLTMGQLQSKAKMLRSVLNNLVPGSENYNRYQAELKQVTARMDELKGKAVATKMSIGGIADGFNRYAALGASAIAGLTGVVLSIQKIIDLNGKLSDAQSDVRKTTGMTAKEVDDLTKSFGAMKTRTSRIDLLGIAEIGGRIGIAKEEIGAFVQVMNKANVALGDSFEGGPEVVAEKLGKIKGLYAEIKDARVEDAFNAVGSAINDLGASGMASEENLADFTTRVGAMPEVLKPTIAEALGLGAAFEESGLKAEIAGTNYGKVISIAARDFPKFAKVMGVAEGKVKDLINTNPTEFFLQFSKSLKGMDATKLSQTLDYLKLNDNEVKMVLGAASQNVDLFREKIELASQSMGEATSLTTEYDLKNNNLQATLDKIKKTVSGWFSSETFVAWLSTSFTWLSKFIGATEDADGSVEGFRNKLILFLKVLTIIITSYISYNAAVKLTVMWTRTLTLATQIMTAMQNRSAIATGLLKSAQLLLASAYYTVTGQTTKATAAMRLFNMTAKANPIGLLIGLLVAAGAAFLVFGNNAKKAVTAQTELYDIQKKTSVDVQDQKDKIAQLLKIAQDRALADEVRLNAIKELNAISPEYLGNITLENVATKATTEAVYAYIKALDKKLELEAIDQKLLETRRRKLDLDQKDLSEYGKWYDGFWSQFFQLSDAADKREKASSERKNKALSEEQKLINGLLERRKQLMMQAGKSPSVVTPGSDFNIEDEDKNKAAEKAKALAEKLERERQKRAEDLKKSLLDNLKLERDAEDIRLELMDEGFGKERQLLETNYTRKLEDLQNKMVAQTDIERALQKSKNETLSKEERDYWTKQAEAWKEHNAHLGTIAEIEFDIHQKKVNTLKVKYSQKELTDLQHYHQLGETERETALNNELLQLGNNEAAKERLRIQYQKNELDQKMAHIRQLIKMQEKLLADGGLDMALLTPEQKKQIEAQIAELKKQISELLLAKQGLQGSTGDAILGAFGDADILGFSANQWQQTFDNITTLEGKLKAANMVVKGLQNIWGAFANYQKANEDAQLQLYTQNADKRKKTLQRQLDMGVINQTQYNRRVEVIDKELDRKKADLEYRQAKRAQQMAVVDAIVNTAKGVTAALGMMPPASFIFAGLTAAMGALQVATIKRQPLPAKGYEEGLYPIKRQQDGRIFNARYGGETQSGTVTKPTYFLTGENGPEMIIDSKAYRRMNPRLRDALLNELRGIKGFEQGYYQNGVLNVPVNNAPSNNTGESQMLSMVLNVLSENTAVMKRIEANGLLAVVSNRDLPSMKKLDEGIQAAKDLRNKNKI